MLVAVSLPTFSAEETEKGGSGVSLKEILFGHVQDAYQWHITDISGKAVVIPLPMIFYSSNSGFYVMCSSQFEHEPDGNLLRKGPNGFYIQGAEDEKGKIVEQTAAGLQPVAFDISITKQVCVLFIDAIILLLCILIPARWFEHKMVSVSV